MATLNEYLPETAQRHLASLRAAVEDRLTALEEVLADPSRGESLEGLILDSVAGRQRGSTGRRRQGGARRAGGR